MADNTSSPPNSETGTIKAGRLPFLVGTVLCALVLVLWQTLKTQERRNLRNKVEVEANSLADQIHADLRNRLPALRRMAMAWGRLHGISKEEFEAETSSYVSDVPGFQAVGWVDANYFMRWIVPRESNENALNLNLAFEENRRLAMEKAQKSRTPAITSPIDLVQGGKGFLAFFPIFEDEKFDGFIKATFRAEEWLDYVFGTKSPDTPSAGYKVHVSFDERPFYKQPGWDSLTRRDLSAMATAKIMGHTLAIHVRPTESFIESNRTFLPLLTAASGVLLSLLVALIVYLYQKTYTETWRAHVAKVAQRAEAQKRKNVEHELQRSLARIDLANKAGHMGVWTWDIATGKLTWDERMFDLYHLSPNITPAYDIWRKAVHPDDLAHAESLLQDALNGKAYFDTEFRIVLPGGDVRHIRAAASVERDCDGKPISVSGLNWDCTKLKHEETALKKSEEHVRLLLNSTGEAIYGIDLQGNCTFANPSCARILGYPDPQSLLGKNMHALIHHSYPGGAPMAIGDCRVHRAFREGKGEHADDEVMWRPDGTSFPVEYWSYPQIDDGKVSGAVVAFVDITERKQTESLLVTERQRLANILDSTNVGTWEWNIQTGEVVLNERWADIIGYRLEELAPISIDTWLKVVHPDDLKRSNDLLDKHFRKELAYYECEVRLRHKHGSWVWVLDRGKVIKWADNGKPLFMYGTHQDISVRKKAEEERETLIANLEKAISEVKKLSGMLPICASCKKIRDDKGYWNQIESYIGAHAEVEFSHGLCPECAKKLYPELFENDGKAPPSEA